MVECNGVHLNGASHPAPIKPVVEEAECKKRCLWFEEELEEDLRWVFGVSKYVPTTSFDCLIFLAISAVLPSSLSRLYKTVIAASFCLLKGELCSSYGVWRNIFVRRSCIGVEVSPLSLKWGNWELHLSSHQLPGAHMTFSMSSPVVCQLVCAVLLQLESTIHTSWLK